MERFHFILKTKLEGVVFAFPLPNLNLNKKNFWVNVSNPTLQLNFETDRKFCNNSLFVISLFQAIKR